MAVGAWRGEKSAEAVRQEMLRDCERLATDINKIFLEDDDCTLRSIVRVPGSKIEEILISKERMEAEAHAHGLDSMVSQVSEPLAWLDNRLNADDRMTKVVLRNMNQKCVYKVSGPYEEWTLTLVSKTPDLDDEYLPV